jgi:hypothetical protein
MVRTRRVAADTDRADQAIHLVVECQTAAEDVNAAGLVAYHRVIGPALVMGRPLVRHVRANGVAVLQSVQAALPKRD